MQAKRWPIKQALFLIIKARMFNKCYQLLLMVYEMPIIFGYSAIQQIRISEEEYLSNLPIITIAYHVLEAMRDKHWQHGLNDHLSKPIKTERFIPWHQLVVESSQQQ